MNTDKALDQYIKSGKNKIGGWFARSDAEIFRILLYNQFQNGTQGAIAEIGVHHGKSFIPLALCNDSRNCYAIDIFGQQGLNIDVSGKGDRERFVANLLAHQVRASDIHIDARLSTDVKADDITGKVGKVRFFHIDGGHHFDAITGDLKLGEQVLLDDGIIAVDDVFRPEWPEVSIGLFAFLRECKTDLAIFAIGYNKTYLCKRPSIGRYRAALLGNEFLAMYLTKKYKARTDEILVFQQYPLPEWDVKARIFNYLQTYHPDLAYRLWKRNAAN